MATKRKNTKKLAIQALKAPADGLTTEERKAFEDLRRSVAFAEEVFGCKDPSVAFGIYDRVFGFEDGEVDVEWDD